METNRWGWARAFALVAFIFFLFTAFGYSQAFTLSASSNSLTIYPGQQNVPVAVTVNSGDGSYAGPVVVTMTGLPSGITAAPVTLTPGSSGTLMLNASASAGQEGFPPNNPSQKTAWTTTVELVGAAGSIEASSQLSLTVSISNPSFAPTPSDINLPIVRIDTSNVPVVDKTTLVPGTITITSADGQTSYLPNSSDADNTATFHVHGTSTSFMPKFAYNIKLHTSLDLMNTMGVSCGYVTGSGKATCDKSKTYILLANYDDKTLMRDWAASALANAIPYGGDYLDETTLPSGSTGTIPTPSGTTAHMPWAPHSLFVELYLNGVYEGNYQLIEKANVDSHRVNISELSESDTDPSQISGGYFLEIDWHEDEAYVFTTTTTGIPIGLQDPDFSPDPEVPAQMNYISNYVDNAEAALFSPDFTNPTTGWRAYFDEASAVNYYIVNDVMGNADSGDFYSSVYLYKDQNNPYLYMGPIWDFDISAGNINYDPLTGCNCPRIVNPTVPWMQTEAPWYAQWFKDPGFKADVVKQWNTLKSNGVFTDWLASIQAQAAKLEQSQANNNGRWPMQGLEVWPNPEAAGNYDGEVNYMLDWLNLRIAYLDSVFNNKAATTTTLTVPGGTLRAGTQVTLSANVTGGSSLTGKVSFLANGMLLGTSPLSGNSASLATTSLPAGNDSLEAVYSGDDKNALSASNPQAAIVASPLIATATSLVVASSSLNSADPANFTVSVLGDSGTATPTGTVTLMSGTASIGSATLAADGTTTFSVPLPGGSDSVTAVYGGDAIYQGSTSNALVLAVAASDFSLAASSSSGQVTATTSSSIILTVTPQNGFDQAVSFSCGTAPTGLSCVFSPVSVTPGSGAVTTTLTFSLTGHTSRVTLPAWLKVGGGFMVCLLLWPFRRRRFPMILVLGAILIGGISLTGCGGPGSDSGSGSSHSTTYPLTVTASGGGVSHSVSIHVVADR